MHARVVSLWLTRCTLWCACCVPQESFVLDNPNYVNLEVKLFTGAVYYNDTSLGEWDFKPSTISMRDDKVLVLLTLVTCSLFEWFKQS